MRLVFAGFSLAGLLLVVMLIAAPLHAGTAMRVEPVTAVTATGRYVFQAEIAATETERQRGLMFRKGLAADAGMLFDFVTPRKATFWMKNTFVGLDLIFIRADGTVARVHENAVPRSETYIGVDEPVRGVLEVIAGTSRRIGLKAGDRVEHPIFTPAP
jgi:uncharacterized protein